MGTDDFEVFYRASRDVCFRSLLVAVGGVDEADECVAEAFTRALSRWDSVAAHPAPSAWVIHTAMNVHRDRWRKTRRRDVRRRLVSDDVPAPGLPVDRALLEALWSLPRRQREVVALRVVADLDTAQTAEILGIAPGTTTAHLHRGLTTLRRQLSGQEVSHE
ncbi:MAG: SigE family RNA polymerase sigma factor [bacterium]|nr:SigE family RNA polymerase sigma factor [bacterium]